MTRFAKRKYGGLREFLGDLAFLWRHRKAIRRMHRGGLAPEFRERLMLAVTEVNQCRYCSYAHSRAALDAGVDEDEVRALLAGRLEAAPEAEHVALHYARHWAESARNPDPEAQERLVGTYGADTAACIHLALRMIATGNYLGNTVDYFLHRLSFGRWGGGLEARGRGDTTA